MSKIKVYTSKGNWSEDVVGLDKVHLIKDAIRTMCLCYDNRTSELINEPLKDFEIDRSELDDDFDRNAIEQFLDDNGKIIEVDRFWAHFNDVNQHVKIREAKTFKLPLNTLKSISKDYRYLTSIYDEIISRALVPAPTPKDYCLLLKFEDE